MTCVLSRRNWMTEKIMSSCKIESRGRVVALLRKNMALQSRIVLLDPEEELHVLDLSFSEKVIRFIGIRVWSEKRSDFC